MAKLNDRGGVLRRLGLTEDSVRQQAGFFLSYAEMLESRSRDDGPDDVWNRIAHPGQQWLGKASLASTYRLAAQYAALVDTRWSTELTIRAGRAYLDAGMPFGLFLLVGVLDDQIVRNDFVRSSLLAPLSAGLAPPSAGRTGDALADPVQQTYVLLAAASRRWLRDSFGEPVERMLRRLDAHSLYPIGPQSVPLDVYLTLARAMLSDDVGQTQVRRIGDQLAVLGRAQAATLRSARQNRYLWERGAAPVNVVDLEYVALCGLALRHNPTWFDQLYRSTTDSLAGDDALAELPMWTMGRINTVLPQMTEAVIDLLIEPDRVWTYEPEPTGAYDAPARGEGDVTRPADDDAGSRTDADIRPRPGQEPGDATQRDDLAHRDEGDTPRSPDASGTPYRDEVERRDDPQFGQDDTGSGQDGH